MVSRTKKNLALLFMILLSFKGVAQLYTAANYGFNIGAIMALGNKFQRLGITLQAYGVFNFIQFNTEVRFYHNIRNLGPLGQYGEIVTSGGVVFGYGPKQELHNPFVSSISNQTGYSNSVAYSFNGYFNKIHTKQQTGTLALQFGTFSIISENDILARPYLDRYRTGAFLLQYQYKDLYQFAVNCTLWTGQMGCAIRNDPHFASGYIDTTGARYAMISHGLLSAQFKTALDPGQNFQANVGVDAEQVRNFVQNKLIHDMAFIPRKWYTPINCHIPMIDEEGNQYLYKPGQKVKKPELYWNVFSSAAPFY
jgi:hypothetical protein